MEKYGGEEDGGEDQGNISSHLVRSRESEDKKERANYGNGVFVLFKLIFLRHGPQKQIKDRKGSFLFYYYYFFFKTKQVVSTS